MWGGNFVHRVLAGGSLATNLAHTGRRLRCPGPAQWCRAVSSGRGIQNAASTATAPSPCTSASSRKLSLHPFRTRVSLTFVLGAVESAIKLCPGCAYSSRAFLLFLARHRGVEYHHTTCMLPNRLVYRRPGKHVLIKRVAKSFTIIQKLERHSGTILLK